MNQEPAGEDVRIARSIVGTLRGRNLSGWQIWTWLGPTRGNSATLTEANLYPTLYSLEADGIIEGKWHEDDRTRREYRLTGTGLRKADAEGWGAVAFRRTRTVDSEGRVSRPPVGKLHTLTADPYADDDDEWSWSEGEITLPGDPACPPGSPEAAAVEAYLDRLDCGLRLARLYEGDVRIEVAEHIDDTITRLKQYGTTSADAAAAALEALGPADTLAEAINCAQRSNARLNRGLGWGAAFAILNAFFGIAACWILLLLGTPVAAASVGTIAAAFGIHLYIPVTAEWSGQAFLVALCAGAFVGARKSVPHVAFRSHRADFDVWRTWAICGVFPLTIIAILMPTSLDPVNAAMLAGIPMAWVVGTRHPAELYGETVFPRGLARGAAVIAIAMLLPAGRIWIYDAGSVPVADPVPAAGATAEIVWDGPTSNSVEQVTVSNLTDGWTGPTVEFWPADRLGPFVAPDTLVKTPSATVANGGFVDYDTLPRGQADWWVTVTATAPDGRRHVVHQELHLGHPKPIQTNIIFWLVDLVRR